jgi:multidrug efflux pump subunit AcrB
MNFRQISAWAIRNPFPPLVLFAGLLLAGILSFSMMGVTNNPDISFPVVQVDISQPGAAPTELETQVTQKVESAVRGVNGVTDLSSFIGEGSSHTTVQFEIGIPVDRALNDVRNAVQQVRGNLPQGILEPQVSRIDFDGGGLAYYSVDSTGMSLEQLSWFVDNTLSKRLLQVAGMASVQRGGGVSREITVTLDPSKMQAFGVTADEVNAQLRAMNTNATGGRLEIAGAEQAVRVLGNSTNAFQLSQMQVQLSSGRAVKLADIAKVEDSYGEQRSISIMNGQQVLSFSIQRTKGASDVSVYDDAQKVIAQIQKENPSIHIRELFTSVKYTKSQYESSISSMIEGALLAVVVVFIFLRDWRATFISALAIPLSAIPTFWLMSLMGFNLNGLSLLALSLVSGVLVDDAIVEIENIVRHMRMGKTAYQASIEAADEIGLAVLATTMAIVAVFLPVGLMPGVSGQFFKNFGLTVVAAVLVSLGVARLITPMVAAYMLRAKGIQEHGRGPIMDLYDRVLRWSLQHRFVTVFGGGGAALALTVVVVMYLGPHSQFQPTINVDNSQVTIQMVPGTTLEQTKAVALRVADIIKESPDVALAFSDIDVGSANEFITLKPDRKLTSVEWERTMAPKLANIADARVYFQSQNGGGFSGRDISLVLTADDPLKLRATADKLVAEMSSIKEITAPRVDGDMLRPEIIIKPRFDLAAQLGVSTEALSNAIRVATQGEVDQGAAKFSLADRQIPVRVKFGEGSRHSLSAIQNLPVQMSNGNKVPLRVVADITLGAGPTSIRHYNQVRRIVIGADLAPGKVSGEAWTKINQLPTLKNLPSGVLQIKQGADRWQEELMINILIALVSGVLLVFAVLVLLYRRLISPIVNIGSLALAPLGGFLGLLITGMPISMPVGIGIILLLGIVAKNSILLVDFAIEEISHGVPAMAAILDAGHKRAQPILMTTIAMVAGMLPTALSFSGDGAWRQPMAVTVIGGLSLSTLLTLVIVPAAFSIAVDIEGWLGPRLRKRILTLDDHLNPAYGNTAAPSPAE